MKKADISGNSHEFDNTVDSLSALLLVRSKLRGKGYIPPRKCRAIENKFSSGVAPLGSYIMQTGYSRY